MFSYRSSTVLLATWLLSLAPLSAHAETVQLYLLGGQSNMVGYGLNSELPPELQGEQTDVRFSTGGRWLNLRPGFGNTGAHFGPELTFGRHMADALPTENVALIKYAVGGTDLANDWRPPDANGEGAGPLYVTFMNRVGTAVNLLGPGTDWEFAGMIWMQGERDSRDPDKAQAYEQNLTDFIASIRDDVAVPDLPFVIGRISNTPTLPYGEIIRQAQFDVSQSVSNTAMINTDDLPRLWDDLHYATPGVLTLGSRFGEGILSIPEPASMISLLCVALLARRPR